MDLPGHIKKKKLDATRMYRSYVLEKRQSIQDCVQWKITHFDKVEDNTSYTSKYDPYGWVLSLSKKRKTLTVGINTKISSQNIECLVVGNKAKAQIAKAEERSEGIYQAKFQANDGKDNFMENTSTQIIFVIANLTNQRFFPMISIKRSAFDRNNLNETMQNVLCGITDTPLHVDFLLRGENYIIPVHKPLLSVRSRFFSENLKTNLQEKALEMGCASSAIATILQFLYTGETPLKGPLDRTLELFEAAVVLGMTGLKVMLTLHIRQTMDPQNVYRIKERATEIGANILKEAAEDFIENNGLGGKFLQV